MVGKSTEQWEKRLKEVFDRIDHELETAYAGTYRLHPSREEHGETSNPESDGLFNVGASFSAGFGSKLGRGYVVQWRMATLMDVSEAERERIEQVVIRRLREELPKAFPRRTLRVERDHHAYKIVGDLGFHDG